MATTDSTDLACPSFSTGQKWAYSLGYFVQWFINSALTTWAFAFYFVGKELPVKWISLAYVVWTIWNSINDPLVGYIMDRFPTRWGRRKPYIVIGLIPLIIVEILLWYPPSDEQVPLFLYLLLMLMLYDTAYTTFQIPYDALFPELYIQVEERAQVNYIRQFVSILGLLAAFLLPGYIITDLGDTKGYLINGVITSIVILIVTLISLKWGVRERPEFSHEHQEGMSFWKSIAYCFRTKGFLLYTFMFFLYEYVLLVLSTVIPFYGVYVLEVGDPFMTSILLGVLFVVGMLSLGLWRKLDMRLGSRKSFAIALLAYMLTSLPLLVINTYWITIITTAFMGIGFGGMLYFIYLLISDVIDFDELTTGSRREASFFGVTNFFMRLSMIFSILTVSFVFTTTGWEEYEPNPGVNVKQGIRILTVIVPAVAILLILFLLWFYPFTKEIVASMKGELDVIHQEKYQRMCQDRPEGE